MVRMFLAFNKGASKEASRNLDLEGFEVLPQNEWVM